MLQTFPNLIVTDLRPFGWIQRGIFQSGDLALAVGFKFFGRRGVVAVAIDDHGHHRLWQTRNGNRHRACLFLGALAVTFNCKETTIDSLSNHVLISGTLSNRSINIVAN